MYIHTSWLPQTYLKVFQGLNPVLVLECKLIKMKWLKKKNTVPRGPETSIKVRHSLWGLVATVFKKHDHNTMDALIIP